MSSFELSPGVVVDADRGKAYVMSPDGEIVALDLAEGTPLWQSGAAAKPLGITGDLLIGQAEAPNELRVVMLDVTKEGAAVRQSVVELPEGVRSSVGDTANRSFVAHADAKAGEVDLSWEFTERPLRGVSPGPLEMLPGEAPPATEATKTRSTAPAAEPGSEVSVIRGAVRLRIDDGSVTRLEAPSADAMASPRSLEPRSRASDLAEQERISGLPEPQFLSADGRHVMTSERVAPATAWDKYLWTVYEYPTGKPVGKVRSHVRFAPFFVAGSRLIFQVAPFERRTDAGLAEEPMQVQAVDLNTGDRVWSQPMRDVVDREPPPP